MGGDGPTGDARARMLDELADLLQTVANLCAALHVDDMDIMAALDRCWERNMIREHADGGTDTAGRPFHPNQPVSVDGRPAVILPSDTWLETIGGRTRIRVRFDSGMVGSYPPGRISHRNV